MTPPSPPEARHWAVLVPEKGLARSDTRYHEWGEPRLTVCKRMFRLPDTTRYAEKEETMVWVQRNQAVKFAEPCKRCYPS